jgi:hypothetical protein
MFLASFAILISLSTSDLACVFISGFWTNKN